jgi:hypothetical protein
MSRNTSAMPISSTPDGAMSPNPTGTRHGPAVTQVVPTWPIIKFAAGMVAR